MKQVPPNTPGFRLRSKREEKGWKQVDLAVEAGISRSHVTHMELNSYRGGRDAWEAVSGALGVSMDWFLDVKSDPLNGTALPPDVIQLIEYYQGCGPEMRKIAMKLIRSLAISEAADKDGNPGNSTIIQPALKKPNNPSDGVTVISRVGAKSKLSGSNASAFGATLRK